MPLSCPGAKQGERNSSLNLPYVAEAIGQLKGIEAAEVIRAARENAAALYFAEREPLGARDKESMI